MLKIYVIIVFTLTITFTTNATKEDDTENRAQNTYHTFDGTPHTYYFGYDSKAKDAPRLMREETRLPDGTVTGRYGYTDPFGVFRVVKYVSGNNGYYATEEIGEQVTSSTPQYYKATAPQVESVSEEPINYSIELATKFNPPLYHPEAHTMSPNDEPEVDSSVQPYSGVDPSYRNHQIFSLSNSEDLLEKKYRERKQTERTSRVNPNQNPVNVLVRQTVSKRVGLLASPYEMPITGSNVEYTDNTRRLNDFNNESEETIKPLIRQNNNNNNDFIRRASIEKQSPFQSNRSHINRFEAKEQNDIKLKVIERKINKNKDITETPEVPVTESHISSTFSTTNRVEREGSIEEDHLPDNISHLYYRPTRSPVISYSTSVSTESQSENKTEIIAEDVDQTDGWTKIRQLFREGSPMTTEPVPTTTTEVAITSTTTDESLPQNQTNPETFSSVFIDDDHEIFRIIPDQLEKEDDSKFVNRNYFFDDEPVVPQTTEISKIDNFFETTTVLTPNQNNFSDTTTQNTETYQNSVNSSEQSTVATVLTTTDNLNNFDQQTQSNTFQENFKTEQDINEFFTQSSKPNLQSKQNQSSEITRSAFFHDFQLIGKNREGVDSTPLTTQSPSTDVQTSETTTDYSLLQNRQNLTIVYDNIETTESTAHPRNEKFLEDFWNNFSEQSVLFSEPLVNNQTVGAHNDSKSPNDETMDWISEQIEKKSIMFSEGRVDNKSTELSTQTIPTTTETPVFSSTITEIVTQTTLETTTPETGSPETTETSSGTSTIQSTTTTIPEVTTTELVNKEFLDNFWHNFNDNSDEYFETIFENKTINKSENSTTLEMTESLLNNTLDKNMAQIDESLIKRGEKLDLDQSEDNNQSLNTTSAAFDMKFLPSIQLSDQNQYMPPLKALFDFPLMRKRVRRVQKQPNFPDLSREEQPTTTSAPEEIDIMSTDATEELTDISDDSSLLKYTASQRVYRYVPPYPVFKESYMEKDSTPEEYSIGKPVQYLQAFDDMSEIVTTIESMRKPKRPQTQESPQTESVVNFDDKPNSFLEAVPDLRAESENIKSRTPYFLPLEPRTERPPERQVPKAVANIRNANHFRAVHRYEPIIRLDV